MGRIAAIDSEEAEQLAKKIWKKDTETGFENIYWYRVADSDGNAMIIFLDCSQNLDNFRIFALISASVSAVELCAELILLLIFREMKKQYGILSKF